MRRIILVAGVAVALATAGCATHAAPAHHERGAPDSHAALPSSPAKNAQARKALARLLKNSRAVAVHAALPGSSVTDSGSYNWSGYASTSSTPQEFTAVSGDWTVPKATCTNEQRLQSDWVGLDGWNTDTVEQDGTTAFCFEGSTFYYSWYEMYPADTVEVGTSVAAGDKIAASVNRSGTTYTLNLTDSTNPANSFSTSQTCALSTCLDESAEWVDERPDYATTGYAPLTQTTRWLENTGRTTAGGTVYKLGAAPGLNSIEMVDSTDSYGLADPSASSPTSGSFTDTWLDSY
jgi:Peptidase A4 family